MKLKEYFSIGAATFGLNVKSEVEILGASKAKIIVPICLVDLTNEGDFLIFYSSQCNHQLLDFLAAENCRYSFMDETIQSPFDSADFEEMIIDWGWKQPEQNRKKNQQT